MQENFKSKNSQWIKFKWSRMWIYLS